MELTDLDIENKKNTFIGLLRDTKREGIEDLISFLEKVISLLLLQVQDFMEHLRVGY